MREGVIHLGMTLQRAPGFPIDIDNLTLRVTGEVNPNMDYNLRHLFVDLSLRPAASGQWSATNCMRPSFTFFADFSFLI